MLHGFTGDKTGTHRLFVHAARAFAAHGIAVLRFDMRGSGDSEGEFQDITLAGEIGDSQVALDWLSSRPDIDPGRIGVIGLSLGGIVESVLAGRNPSRIRGLAYWAAAANTDVFMHMAERTADKSGKSTNSLMDALISRGYILVWGYPVGLPFIQTFFAENPLEELKNYLGKAIVIHSKSDPTVPANQADVFAQHFGERAQIHILDEDTHTFETPGIEESAIDLTLEWFNECFTK
jgi:uncharacterized protein